MMPVLFGFGPIKIYSFGLFLTLGIVLGMYICWKKAREYHIESDVFFDMVFRSLVWSVVFGRAIYVIWNFASFGMSPIKWVWLSYYPGIDLWGAFLGALVSLWWSARVQDLKMSVVGDLASLGTAFGIACSWLGAFLNGTPMSISIKNLDMYFGAVGSWMFPAHIVFFLLFLFLDAGLWYLEPNYRTFEWYRRGKSSAKTGFLSGVFLICFGVFGILSRIFFVERRYIGWLDWDVTLSLVSMIFGILIILVQSGRLNLEGIKKLKVVRGWYK